MYITVLYTKVLHTLPTYPAACSSLGGSKCDPHGFYTSILREVTIPGEGRTALSQPPCQFLRWCSRQLCFEIKATADY